MFVAFVSVDVYADTVVDTKQCNSGQFAHPDDSDGWTCEPCPAGCDKTQYLPADGTVCVSCLGDDVTWNTEACGSQVYVVNRKPQGFYCPGNNISILFPDKNNGIHDCPAEYPYSDSANESEDSCYVEIPFFVGNNVTFHGHTVGSDGFVMEKMYKCSSDPDDDSTVFFCDTDANPGNHLKAPYLSGSGVPTRSGYTFAGWEMKKVCTYNIDPTYIPIASGTIIEPVWGQQGLCNQIRAVWCSNAGNEVPNGNGECVCKQGYHSVEGSCVSCEHGMTTDGPGEECHYVFKYGSSGGTWKWPDSIENVDFNDDAFAH